MTTATNHRPNGRARPIRVGLFGEFGTGNLGNEGSLSAMLTILRQSLPEAQLTAVCHSPLQVTADHGVPAVPIRSPRYPSTGPFSRGPLKLIGKLADMIWALRRARQFDLIVVPGTGILEEVWVRPGGVPYWLFCTTLGVRLRRRRLALVSVGVQTPNHPVTRWFFSKILRWADYRSFRDRHSAQAARAIGLDTDNDPIYPDLAFSLPVPREHTVGVGVMAYYGASDSPILGAPIHAAYVDSLLRFGEWLLDRGWNVQFLTGDVADESVALDLKTRLAVSRPSVPPERVRTCHARSLDELMTYIDTTDIVVASRYHNVVCSLMLARPTISISYADKNDDLMTRVGLGAYTQPIESLDSTLLIKQFEEIEAKRSAVSAKIRYRSAGLATLLTDQAARIEGLIQGWGL